MKIINVTFNIEHNELIEYATTIANRARVSSATLETMKAFLISTIKDRHFVVIAENEKEAEHHFLSKVNTTDLAQIDDMIEL